MPMAGVMSRSAKPALTLEVGGAGGGAAEREEQSRTSARRRRVFMAKHTRTQRRIVRSTLDCGSHAAAFRIASLAGDVIGPFWFDNGLTVETHHRQQAA